MMESSSEEDLAGLLGLLSIVKKTNPSHPSSTQPTLREAIQILTKSAEITLDHAQRVESLADGKGLHVTGACSLHEIVTELVKIQGVLADTVNKLDKAIEHSVVTRLSSLGSQSGFHVFKGSQIPGLLKYFDGQIRHNVREVLSDLTDRDRVLCKVIEMCYTQATSTSGALQPVRYFFEKRIFDKKERDKERQSWIHFWVEVLDRCPGGPTLFYPRATSDVPSFNYDLSDVPQYLFRTFDEWSSGRNDENVIASTMSKFGPTGNSRDDIFSLEKRKAVEMLYSHLTKGCFEGKYSDNLMSWTSSLLYAIQYAIFRCQFLDRPASKVKICVVDTRKFPHGQFARDMWLLQTYNETAQQVGGDTRRFFRFRQEDGRYQNGEYLSQGSLKHSGRSCVVSLKSLMNSGLCELYPELAEADGFRTWSNRVLELRQRWSTEQKTTQQERQLASEMAKKCFSNFSALDMALMLLTFKNREFRDGIQVNQHVPEWGRKPDEVRRYLIAAEAVKLRGQRLEEAFQCT